MSLSQRLFSPARLQAWWRRLFRRGLPSESDDRLWQVIPQWMADTTPISDAERIELYRDTAYFCANLNARGVARTPLRLYVRTAAGQPAPRTATRQLKRFQRRTIETKTGGAIAGEAVDEVLAHPLLDLLRAPARLDGQPQLSRFELFEWTQLYLEVTGRAYWLIERDVLGVPANLWLLPTQVVFPRRSRSDGRLLGYEIRLAGRTTVHPPDAILPFRVANLADPYGGGMSPLESALAAIRLERSYERQAQAMLDNRARPDALITPAAEEGILGEAEARRLEQSFQSRFRGSGMGAIFVSRESLRVTPLSFSPRDMVELAERRASLEQIARAFDIPLSMLHRDATRAVAEAGRAQHAMDAIWPRCQRIEDVLNARLVPFFDPTGRLFVAYDDPVPGNVELDLRRHTAYVRAGILTPNEVRAELGWPPIAGGDRLHAPATGDDVTAVDWTMEEEA